MRFVFVNEIDHIRSEQRACFTDSEDYDDGKNEEPFLVRVLCQVRVLRQVSQVPSK